MEFVTKIGGQWQWSEIYYNEKEKQFIQDCYHEEYLDTGTIHEGAKPISDGELWKILISEMNEGGIKTFLEIRGSIPKIQVDDELTFEELSKEISKLKFERPNIKYSLTKINDVTIIFNEKNTIIGVISKATNYWYYIGYQRHGFTKQEEAFDFALKQIKRYHYKPSYNDTPTKNKAEQTKMIESMSTNKKGIFSKLFGK